MENMIKIRTNIKRIFKKLKHLLIGTYTRAFVSFYAFFTLFGAIMLKLPISQKNNTLKFIDAIFISASGMSTTGLSTVTVADELSTFGIFVLAFILQFGGIGLMMLIAGFWIVIRKRITFKERALIMTDQNQIKMSGVVKLVRNIIVILLIIEGTGFLLLGTYFWAAGYFPFWESYLQGFFLAVSMTTNAGFDITGDSLFRYANDYYVQFVAMFLMFSGAVGFWPLVEFKEWLSAKRKKERFEFSVFAKILFSMHLGMMIIGAGIFFVLESNNFLADKGAIESVFYSLFMSLTTRNAGFATMDVGLLKNTTIMFFNFLMFVGSSPNSAGGGIRTTTFLVVIAAIYSFSIGREQVVVKKKSIKKETVYRSLLALIVALGIVVFATTIMTITESSSSIKEILFEVCSAFGTTGLSLGITPDLSSIGKIIIIAIMFIGRIGVLTLLLIFKENTHTKNKIKYPEIDLIVG